MRTGVVLLALACASCTQASGSQDPKATEVLERTRTTKATYSLYNWNLITPPDGEASEEWGAEFNQGPLHRVETPRDRVIADCVKMEAKHLSIETGEILTGESEAKSACGIDANRTLRSSRWLGQGKSRFGPIDQVRLTDDAVIRTYKIAANGAIVAETISGLDGTERLVNHAVALVPTVPAGDIFSEASLQRSVVPDQYKTKPNESGQSR